MKHVLVIPGDGIGPEVVKPSIDIIRNLADGIDFEYAEAGKKYYEKTGESISKDTLAKAKAADAIFFGATTSVREVAYKSPIMTLRQRLDLFANVRPIKSILPGMKNIDMVIVRENTEGLYTQNEEEDLDGVTTYRRVSRIGCERIVKFAFSWCKQNSCKKIVCVHKANVLRASDGLFLDIFKTEATKNKKIDSFDMLVDATAMKMVMKPEDFDAIVTLNLYGDILSDLGAGLVGGLGFVPSANIGAKHAMFEPAHGSAPDIAGKGIANPIAALMSSKMMLDYLGFKKEGQILSDAIEKTIVIHRDTIDAEGRCKTASCIDALKMTLNEFMHDRQSQPKSKTKA